MGVRIAREWRGMCSERYDASASTALEPVSMKDLHEALFGLPAYTCYYARARGSGGASGEGVDIWRRMVCPSPERGLEQILARLYSLLA